MKTLLLIIALALAGCTTVHGLPAERATMVQPEHFGTPIPDGAKVTFIIDTAGFSGFTLFVDGKRTLHGRNAWQKTVVYLPAGLHGITYSCTCGQADPLTVHFETTLNPGDKIVYNLSSVPLRSVEQ